MRGVDEVVGERAGHVIADLVHDLRVSDEVVITEDDITEREQIEPQLRG